MTKYTTLNIHQAIDLVKAGCEDVELMCIHIGTTDINWVKIDKDLAHLIYNKYRINTQALEEFNNLKQ